MICYKDKCYCFRSYEHWCKENNIPFYYGYAVSSYSQLEALKDFHIDYPNINIKIENNLTLGIMGSASTLGNVNSVFTYGGHGGFEELSPFTKIIFMINMLVGRLELIPFIAMLHPDFWKFNTKKEQ